MPFFFTYLMSLNEAKKQLADAIAKYEHLKLKLSDKDNLESYSEQEWHAHLSNLGLQTVISCHLSLCNANLIHKLGSIDQHKPSLR